MAPSMVSSIQSFESVSPGHRYIEGVSWRVSCFGSCGGSKGASLDELAVVNEVAQHGQQLVLTLLQVRSCAASSYLFMGHSIEGLKLVLNMTSGE